MRYKGLIEQLKDRLGERVNFVLYSQGGGLGVFGGRLTGDSRSFSQEDYWIFHKEKRAGRLRTIYDGSTGNLVVLQIDVNKDTLLSVNGKSWYSGRNFETRKIWSSRNDFTIPQAA